MEIIKAIDSPKARHEHKMHTLKYSKGNIWHEKTVLIWGGIDGIKADIYLLDTRTYKFAPLEFNANTPGSYSNFNENIEPRSSFGSCSFNEFVYIYGGLLSNGEYSSDLLVLDFELLTIKKIETVFRPKGLMNPTLIIHQSNNDTLLTIFGGMLKNLDLTNDIYQYSFNKKDFTMLKTKGYIPPPREAHTSVHYYGVIPYLYRDKLEVEKPHNYMISFGGFIKAFNHIERTRDLLLLNLDTMHIETKPGFGQIPHGRALHSCVIDGDYMYVQGGCVQKRNDAGVWEWQRTAETYVLGIQNLQWENLKTFADDITVFARSQHSSVIVDNLMFTFGGLIGNGYEEIKCSDQLLALQITLPEKIKDFKIYYGTEKTAVSWSNTYSNTAPYFIVEIVNGPDLMQNLEPRASSTDRLGTRTRTNISEHKTQIQTDKNYLIIPSFEKPYFLTVAQKQFSKSPPSRKLTIDIQKLNLPRKIVARMSKNIELKFKKDEACEYTLYLKGKNEQVKLDMKESFTKKELASIIDLKKTGKIFKYEEGTALGVAERYETKLTTKYKVHFKVVENFKGEDISRFYSDDIYFEFDKNSTDEDVVEECVEEGIVYTRDPENAMIVDSEESGEVVERQNPKDSIREKLEEERLNEISREGERNESLIASKKKLSVRPEPEKEFQSQSSNYKYISKSDKIWKRKPSTDFSIDGSDHKFDVVVNSSQNSTVEEEIESGEVSVSNEIKISDKESSRGDLLLQGLVEEEELESGEVSSKIVTEDVDSGLASKVELGILTSRNADAIEIPMKRKIINSELKIESEDDFNGTQFPGSKIDVKRARKVSISKTDCNQAPGPRVNQSPNLKFEVDLEERSSRRNIISVDEDFSEERDSNLIEDEKISRGKKTPKRKKSEQSEVEETEGLSPISTKGTLEGKKSIAETNQSLKSHVNESKVAKEITKESNDETPVIKKVKLDDKTMIKVKLNENTTKIDRDFNLRVGSPLEEKSKIGSKLNIVKGHDSKLNEKKVSKDDTKEDGDKYKYVAGHPNACFHYSLKFGEAIDVVDKGEGQAYPARAVYYQIKKSETYLMVAWERYGPEFNELILLNKEGMDRITKGEKALKADKLLIENGGLNEHEIALMGELNRGDSMVHVRIENNSVE